MSTYRFILAIFVGTLVTLIIASAITVPLKELPFGFNVSSVDKSLAPANVGVKVAGQTSTPSVSPTPAPVMVYVASDGVPGNSGASAMAPIDLATAVSASGPVRAGYTVQLSAGIYRYSSVTFAPAGSGPDNLTIFKAAPGARVIITTPSNTPPDIYLKDYMRLDGLWIGGARQTSDATGIYFGGSPISRWKQMVNCTIFGYMGAVKASETEYALFQGNRFVHTGGNTYFHSIYISSNDPFPGPAGTVTQHNIVDNNLFVAGGDGYAVHFWHNNHTNIITRNFVAKHGYGIVHDGSDALVANNLMWRTTHEAMWMPGTREYVVNNVFGASAYFVGSRLTNVTGNNAFAPNDGARGTGMIDLTSGQEAAQLGLSATAIDSAIATLDTAFYGSVDDIFADTKIEPAFATLKLVVPIGSPLYGKGTPWFGSPVNLGPDSPAPASVSAFWQAFRALGLQEFDSNGNVITP